MLNANDVSIRKIDRNDTANIIRWRNSEHVMNVFIDRTPLTEEIHNRWLEEKVNTGEVAQFIIRDEVNGRDIGSVYFKDIDESQRKAEFGIFIGELDHLGRGYGKLATVKALDHAFSELGLDKVYARVLRSNDASNRMFRNLGFSTDDTIKDVMIDGEAAEVIFYSILKKEWEAYEA